MKNIGIFLLFIFFTNTYGYNATIYFTSPTQNQIVTNTYLSTHVPVYTNYYKVLDPQLSGSYFIKIFANETYNSKTTGLPQWIDLVPGNYTWRIELWQYDPFIYEDVKTAEQTINFSVKFTITTMNNFQYGTIYVDGASRNSPFLSYKNIGESINANAIEQNYNSNSYVWNNNGTNNSAWYNYKQGYITTYLTNNSNLQYNIQSDDNGCQIKAILKKNLSINIENTFNSVGNGGTVLVNGAQFTSPKNVNVIEENALNLTAQDQTINGIDYTFNGWYNGAGANASLLSSSRTVTFNPSGNSSYYAHFTGIPNVSGMQVQSNSAAVNQYPTITWTDNINSNVSYKIYRRLYNGSTWGSYSLLQNINKGVQSFSYTEMYNEGGPYSDLMLKVEAYYTAEGTSAAGGIGSFDANWFINIDKRIQKESIISYKLNENYPNPFNPTTQISYELPEDQHVKLTVFNSMGEEIQILENSFKAAGYHMVEFNASEYSSGIYFYKIESGKFMQVKKMLLAK